MPNTNSLFDLANMHLDLIGYRGMLAQANQGDVPGNTVIIKRPWIDEPEGSVPFDEQNGIALPALPGDTVVMTFIVPNGYDGVIKWISNNFLGGGFVPFSGDIVWRIFADQKPVRNFQAIQSEKGTQFIPRSISPIRIYSGQTITYTVNHVANVALAGQVICSMVGYIYPANV